MPKIVQFTPGQGRTFMPPPAIQSLASPWSRLGASILDSLLLLIPTLVLLESHWLPVSGTLGVVAANAVPEILYGGALVAVSGRTLGMRACGIRVVPVAPGSTLTAGRAWLRAACFTLPSVIPTVGFLCSLVDCAWMLWDRPNRQTLHDKVARTVVVTVDA